MNDASTLLRELRPETAGFDPRTPTARAALEQILATPPDPPRRPRRQARRLAIAAAGAAAAAIALVAWQPFTGSSPDVVARAADAVDAENAILHVFSRERLKASGVAKLDEDDPSTYDERTFEMWQTEGRRQERWIHDGDKLEHVRDIDTKTMLAYVKDRDELIRDTKPEYFEPDTTPQHLDSPFLIHGAEVRDLPRMLQRARDGDDRARITGETTVRGIAVYELQIDFEVDVYDGPDADAPYGVASHKEIASRLVYIDRDRYVPVRIVERAPRGLVVKITDFLTVEELPRTTSNEKLLEMSPHPGAKEIVRD